MRCWLILLISDHPIQRALENEGVRIFVTDEERRGRGIAYSSSWIENLDRVFPYFVIFNSWNTWLDIKFGIS